MHFAENWITYLEKYSSNKASGKSSNWRLKISKVVSPYLNTVPCDSLGGVNASGVGDLISDSTDPDESDDSDAGVDAFWESAASKGKCGDVCL